MVVVGASYTWRLHHMLWLSVCVKKNGSCQWHPQAVVISGSDKWQFLVAVRSGD